MMNDDGNDNNKRKMNYLSLFARDLFSVLVKWILATPTESSIQN